MYVFRLDFTKDMHVLAMLQNSNIAKMIALVEEEPFGAIFEYGQFGDLPTFLENRENLDNKEDIRWKKYLNVLRCHFFVSQFVSILHSYGSLLSFIIQIASGMKYLESMNIAHCDLAAR